ncbi:MAG: TonB-dependent receptor [Gallionella sp.]|nr:TonB-dependent receptor [Gallionella sp.]
MKILRILPILCIAGLGILAGTAQAADESPFLGEIQPPLEQTVGHGQTALWTLPDIATQYQPLHPTPAIQAALQAQREGRFLEALIVLEEAVKGGQASEEARAEMNLLRSSFLLQGQQPQQALEILAPLTGKPQHAADAWALTAMAHLQQGQLREALETAQRARDEDLRNKGGGFLAHLSLSYVLQGMGQLAEARAVVHEFNSREPQQAVVLAREAELALTLDQVQTASALAVQAQESMAENPYVVAVGGLVDLIGGRAGEARAAFEAALRYDPRDTRALLGLGLAEIKLGNFAAGLKQLQAANATSPGNALILTYLGRAQQQAGQTEAAMASWRSAQQADPKDPIPWLYQAQAELQANRLLEAQQSLREAQARAAYRSVYRGENLLREDQQLLQANLAAIQKKLGMENLAFHTLADSPGEKNASNLRNQADLLQGQRFGESARRSLLLQSLFNERPGNLPAELDIYGDGSWETGASVPQHGVVSELGAQHASLNNYDELFGARTTLEADAITGSQNTRGEQVRLGAGSDKLGLGLAQRQFKTGGNGQFDNLDNRLAQAIVQWRPLQSTQAFVSYQTFNSQHEEMLFPGDPGNAAQPLAVEDDSRITRLGLRHSLTESSELRALWSRQQTGQLVDYLDPATGMSIFINPGSSRAHSAELQYRAGGAGYATQWGVQQTRGQLVMPLFGADFTKTTRQVYAARQQALGPHWQLEAQLGWGKSELLDNTGGGNGTYLRRWLPGLGLVYAPDDATHLRLAAWRGMAMSHLGDAALAPVSLAGILLSRPGDNQVNGALVRGVALGADQRLGSAWLLEGRAQRHRIEEPRPPLATQTLFSWHSNESRLALHWQPGEHPWAATLAFEQERFQAPPLSTFVTDDSLQEQRLRAQQLELRWFAAEKWTAKLAWSRNRVDGTLQTNWFSTLLPYRDSFNQADASLDWQIAGPVSLSAGVRNATGRRFQYTNTDPLNPRFSDGRLAYAKLRLAW